MTQTQLDALEKLRQVLLKSKTWPMRYMYKFIVPNSGDRVNKVVALLPEGSNPTFKASKDLHYVAVTLVANVCSPDEVIETTQRAMEVEGVIAL